MALDFTEIAPPNKKSKDQLSDAFELFAEAFLQALGFRVVEGPSRGADGGKDLVVAEAGALTQKTRRWLVSCKHKAFSGNAVASSEENNLHNRLRKARCSGFLAFYSTLPATSLEGDFRVLEEDNYDVEVYNASRIEQHMLDQANPVMTALAKQYFPASYKKWLSLWAAKKVCVTIADINALAHLRRAYSTFDSRLKALLPGQGVELYMAPWTWAQVTSSADTSYLLNHVIRYFGIKELPQPLVLIAEDLFSIAQPHDTSFDDYVSQLECFDIERFILGVERQLKQVKSIKSISESIGALLGLKQYEVENIGKSKHKLELREAIRGHLEALKPSEQLVKMLMIDTELSDKQKTDRAYATLTATSLTSAVEAHHRVRPSRIPSHVSLDARVCGVIKSVAAHWLATDLDFSGVKTSEVPSKMPHLRAMLSYLFGDGKGFKPVHSLELRDRELLTTMFSLIYAPDCKVFSVSGHPLAPRLKHGLMNLTIVKEGASVWGAVLQDVAAAEKEGLLTRLESCYTATRHLRRA